MLKRTEGVAVTYDPSISGIVNELWWFDIRPNPFAIEVEGAEDRTRLTLAGIAVCIAAIRVSHTRGTDLRGQ